MYTQCPECGTAFRITAQVLKQAAGKVRCGGCGSAFNALEYLSEQMPERPAPKEPDPSLPELTPEPIADDPEMPSSISAEQSAALLKTLDELAGSDIRIEDTGIEWRVLDDDEKADGDDELADVIDTRITDVDELLDESPTPVDQFLTATPPRVDAAEIFDESAIGPEKTPVDELRFDDNTPLPDDFGFDEDSSHVTPSAGDADPEPVPVAETEEHIEQQPDFDLSEPGEWTDILDEFDVLGDSTAPPLAAELEAEALAAEESISDDVEPSRAADEILDMDTQFALQAEAMGIDLSGMHESPAAEEPEDADEPPVEAAADEEPAEEPAPDDEPAEAEAGDEDDEATQLDLVEDEEAEPVLEQQEEPPLEFGSFEKELRDLEEQSNVFDEDFFDSTQEPQVEPETNADEADVDEGDVDEGELEVIEAFDLDEELALEEQPDLKEELDLGAEPYPEAELDLDTDSVEPEADATDEESGEQVVPPMTEEEQTINMLIDQDLMSMAIEDEDGFASTIIIPDKEAPEGKSRKSKDKKGKARSKRKDKKKKKKDLEEVLAQDEGPEFETIIMEGEFVRNALDEGRHEAHAAEAAAMVEQAKADEAAVVASARSKRVGLISGVVVLVLLLLVQGIHQWRETLATIPAINSILSPVYRLIGKPLSPSWDVASWRFEATQRAPSDTTEALTLYSRLGNTSDKPLPYPLINISLTDRFEEVIGSRMLDPADYLASGLDPGELVAPGANFEAVISIQSPSDAATGYKLMPCYRSGGQLRCYRPAFK